MRSIGRIILNQSAASSGWSGSSPPSGLERPPYYTTKDGHVSKAPLNMIGGFWTKTPCLCGVESIVQNEDIGKSYIVTCAECETIYNIEEAHS
jgi:hypothetical protein